MDAPGGGGGFDVVAGKGGHDRVECVQLFRRQHLVGIGVGAGDGEGFGGGGEVFGIGVACGDEFGAGYAVEVGQVGAVGEITGAVDADSDSAVGCVHR